jgi:hypothetical protein
MQTSRYQLIAEDGTVYSFKWTDTVDVIASRGRGLATVEFLRDQQQPFTLCNTQPAHSMPDEPITCIKIVKVETTTQYTF